MTAARRIPAWQVTGQMEATEVTPQGTVMEGYRVSFQTAAGHQGTVFVPRAQYAQDKVRAAVADQAQLLDSVGAMTSEDEG